MFGRDEKVSALRLTAVQYIILVVFLILAYGLWRLQVMQSDFYAGAGGEKPHSRCAHPGASRTRFSIAKGAVIVDNYPSFSALLMRDSSRDLNADAELIAQGLHMDPKELRERIRHFAGHAAVPAHLSLRTTSRRTSWRSSRRTRTNCRSWIRSWRTGACIREMASWRT